MVRGQAEHFTLLGSPVYGRLAGQLAGDPRPARAILGDVHGNWPDRLDSP